MSGSPSLFSRSLCLLGVSLVTQMEKNPPAVQETQVLSLDRENPLEEEMATHSIFFSGEFLGQRRLGGSRPWGRKESDTTE